MNGFELQRRLAGYTQAELAELLNVNQTAVSSWERGTYIPNAQRLPKIAEILRCQIEDLLVEEIEHANNVDERDKNDE
jgi:transcriptional regulator with XRE-family HTH domain